jgi:hypothetical protein
LTSSLFKNGGGRNVITAPFRVKNASQLSVPRQTPAHRPREARKMFFSEEKNQKTFVPPPAEGLGLTTQRDAAQKLKDFCFFSSEKKTLPYFLDFIPA